MADSSYSVYNYVHTCIYMILELSVGIIEHFSRRCCSRDHFTVFKNCPLTQKRLSACNQICTYVCIHFEQLLMDEDVHNEKIKILEGKDGGSDNVVVIKSLSKVSSTN